MELLLETFILFSCLMFWVVFFHKKGTLAKIKKIEASIQSKIHILEDLASKYSLEGKPNAPTKTQEVHSEENLKALLDISENDKESTHVEEKPATEKTFSKPIFSTEKVLSKVISSANIFEQKIESMLKSYESKTEVSMEAHPAEEAAMETAAPVVNLEHDEQLEQIIEKDMSFKKQAKVVVPRTKPVESFQDVINLSKAIEREQTKG